MHAADQVPPGSPGVAGDRERLAVPSARRNDRRMTSYLGSGEYRDRYLGVKIPPTNLQDYHLDAARKFAAGLADRLLAGSLGARPKRQEV
jgi:hypothetical protein